MGQAARLRFIRDRFVAGHNSCELRRHLDSVPPETPIQDIVDRCRVWESHADSDVRRASKPGPDQTVPTYMVSGSDRRMDDLRVAAVTTPVYAGSVGDLASRRLLAGTPAPAPAPNPEAGAPHGGTVVTALVGGNLGSTACPGFGGWEF